ncbi:hypothetical protein [Rubellicoccus peritrichatus]|uniref:Uncharacterized protein n=1 Tax=Rubellicoccus peritrichatus TaxID=3080537 RepID=A0AAQ3LE68_9BACT|nr:hypothetical protein [Puniceicoccus sp. CR14]WOO43012.1 hypothetical protein RZN69_07895 [Puniceicoccus sp. CR14]
MYFRKIILGLSLAVLAVNLSGQEAAAPGTAFVFEGKVVEVNSDLTPDVNRGQVISGTLRLVAQPEPVESDDARRLVYANAITAAEFTLDQNYVATYAGSLRQGEDYVALVDSGERTDDPDLYSFHIPVTGDTLKDEYVALWLEIFLSEDTGTMIDSDGLTGETPEYDDAWFYLTFYSSAGGVQAVVSGEITQFFIWDGDLPEQPDQVDYEAMILELDETLRAKDAEIATLKELLERARAELVSRNAIIDQLKSSLADYESGTAEQKLVSENQGLRNQLQEARASQAALGSAMKQLSDKEKNFNREIQTLQAENAALLAKLNAPVEMPQPASEAYAAPLFTPGIVEADEPDLPVAPVFTTSGDELNLPQDDIGPVEVSTAVDAEAGDEEEDETNRRPSRRGPRR